MGAKTLTISISEEDYGYLKEDGLLSPSSIFRVAMQQIRDSRENIKEKLKFANERAKRYEDMYLEAVEFIHLHELGEKWKNVLQKTQTSE